MHTSENRVTKATILSNLFWKYSERMGNQLVSFFVSIVLARLLMPQEYGMIAMVTVFIEIANVFVVSGFGNALIQKKSADNVDFSSVFFFNIGFSIIMYGFVFICAPVVADFYGYEMLCPVMRVLGLRIVIGSVNVVQNAYVSRKLIFKRFFYSTVSGTLISGVVGVAMAYLGFGIWALVAQTMTSVIVGTIVLWFTVRWRPQLRFSMTSIKGLFSFGWKLLVAGLLNTLAGQLRQLIIGKMYTASDLAYYNKGNQFPGLIMANINDTISAVMFPVVSRLQDDSQRIKHSTRLFIRVSSYFIFPMLVGLAVVAEPFVRLLLTEKWIFSVPYLRIGCFSYGVVIIQIAIQNAIMAQGRSDVFLKMDIIRKILNITILILVMKKGVMAIASTTFITGTISVVMVAVVSKHLFSYQYREHIQDNLPVLLASALMGVLVYMVSYLGFSDFVTLCIQIPAGVLIYLLLSVVFKFEGFTMAVEFIHDFRKKGRKHA